MKGFKDLKIIEHDLGKFKRGLEFPNGYGVSVICTSYSYGGRDGLYELAVLDDGQITYSTPITDDVIGFLNETQVTEIMHKVYVLKRELD